MRVLSRVALVVIVLILSVSPLAADHLLGECPLTLVGSDEVAGQFYESPHGSFRSGNQVFVLRGGRLATYSVNDLGDLVPVREDTLGTLAGRSVNGGVTFNNGYLYISSDAGLEVFDLRQVRPGGSDPTLVSRTAGMHYTRLAANGSVLAALYSAQDLPCYPTGSTFCYNTIDLISIADPAHPFRISQISSLNSSAYIGFDDIAFNRGFLYAAARGGVIGFNLTNPSAPVSFGAATSSRGTFFVTNNVNLLGVGNEGSIDLFTVAPNGALTRFAIFNLANITIDRSNPIMFHPQAWIDEASGRLFTLVDEKDPQTLKPARTVAFDVFDLTVPMWEGSFQRGFEDVSYVTPDEVKHNPILVGSSVYVVGERNGVQAWGSCGVASGRIEWDTARGFNCGGTELRGWVTAPQKTANVEILLDNGSLGSADLGGPLRTDVSSRWPVQTWRLSVNLDNTTRGEHTLRAIATDAFGNRRQIASVTVFFAGPGSNCTNRRRAAQ